jgi:hypothetical protein
MGADRATTEHPQSRGCAQRNVESDRVARARRLCDPIASGAERERDVDCSTVVLPRAVTVIIARVMESSSTTLSHATW